PRQLRGPTDLALDLADELTDFGGGRLRLLALDADERRFVLLIGEPHLRGAVDEQGERDRRDEERHVLAKQSPARLGGAGGRRLGSGRCRVGGSDIGRGVVHSMTSSARAMSVGGISRPSVLAVLRLMTSSSFVGCSTGRLAGRAPLKILSISP